MSHADPAELFTGTAEYYAKFRPGYPSEMFLAIVRDLQLSTTSRVLEVGSGTGHFTLGMAPYVGEIVAVEPARDMNDQVRLAAEREGVHNIRIVEGDSSTLRSLGRDQFEAAFFAAAFHWTDRDETLRVLDDMIKSGGAVVVVSGASATADPPWQTAIDDVRARWLGPVRRAGSGVYEHPKDRHETVLQRSAFSEVTVTSFTWPLTQTLDELVGCQFSYSHSSPALLGENKPRFEDELFAVLRGFSDTGTFVQTLQSEVLTARRPRD
ncbi:MULTISPECIES: class I SAM-dependent methyltransferase [Arthrobacter]|nr:MULTISPECIES: class I SAM-dependent methyltransferase [Arthrobacter]MBT8163001.1 class I SAM-dependent methyltransferase [Arthrobacter sp. GN70]